MSEIEIRITADDRPIALDRECRWEDTSIDLIAVCGGSSVGLDVIDAAITIEIVPGSLVEVVHVDGAYRHTERGEHVMVRGDVHDANASNVEVIRHRGNPLVQRSEKPIARSNIGSFGARCAGRDMVHVTARGRVTLRCSAIGVVRPVVGGGRLVVRT